MITFGEPITFPILGVTGVACYRDGEHIGNISQERPDGPWNISKNLINPMVYFERIEEAKAFVNERFGKVEAGK